MPALRRYHQLVKDALIADGWTITHDPLTLQWGTKDMFVDLGAERLFGAEKAERKIAVEVKSFSGPSEVAELEQALGQYLLYHTVLNQTQPERQLYLAVTLEVFTDLFDDEPLGRLVLTTHRLQLLVFDPVREVISKWIP